MFLSATSTSSNSKLFVTVPFRCELMGAAYATTPLAAQTAAGTLDIIVLSAQTTTTGMTIPGWGGLTVSTSTGKTSTRFAEPTAETYLNSGDVLCSIGSSLVGGTISFLTREF